MFPDLLHALTLIRRRPRFAAAAVGLLGCAIGAATAVFTLVNTVVLAAMPFRDPDALLWMYNARTERDRAPLSIPDLEDYRRDNRSLEGIAAFTNWTANLTGNGEAERIEGVRVAGNFFRLLDTQPVIGRLLQPDDEATDARDAVLAFGLWQRRFGADPSVVGRSVQLNGVGYRIVGVLPANFVFPFRYAEVAVPLALRDDPRRANRGANFLRVIARRKAGVSTAQATADLDAIAHRLQRQFPVDDARKVGISLYPLHAEIVRDYASLVWMLFGAVTILLVIGCGNFANLVLLRAVERRPELALRVVLGAGRGRVARQLCLEAATLALAGGTVGLLVTKLALQAWTVFGPTDFPRLAIIALDLRVVGFAAVVSVFIAALCGVVPAWSATRDLALSIGSATRALTYGRRQSLIRRTFVVVQVAGSAGLLVCVALAAKSLARLQRVDPGFTPDQSLTVQLSLPPNQYSSREAVSRFSDALALRLGALPAVQRVGAVSLLPLSGLLATMDVEFPGRPAPPPDEVPQAHFRIATAGYFAAAGIGVVEGREFDAHDTAHGAPVAVVSEAFASRHWPGRSAIGQPLRIVQPTPEPALTIVGVVRNVHQFGLDGAPTPDLYVPVPQMPRSQVGLIASRMYWVVRTASDGRTIAPGVRDAVRGVDPDVATSSTRTLEDMLAGSVESRRLNVELLEIFGAVAMLLAAIGTYAIAAFGVDARRRELAIRSAFGASRRALGALIVRTELLPLAGALAIGLGVAEGLARGLGEALYGTSPADPAVYGGVAVAMLIVIGLATWVPARRAAAADPAELLHP